MSDDTDLLAIADQIDGLRMLFKVVGAVEFLPVESQAEFKRLSMEAKAILDRALRFGNDFSFGLMRATNAGSFGRPSISVALLSETAATIRGGVNHLRRQPIATSGGSLSTQLKPPYVAPSRLADIRSVKGGKWDLTRLAQLCGELNVANENNCHMTIAMLVRAIVDHIPPIFGQPNFESVANNYAGRKSFKGSMQRLNGSLRKIADAHLHTQVRKRESIPTEAQVRFGPDLDVLLAEVVRISTS